MSMVRKMKFSKVVGLKKINRQLLVGDFFQLVQKVVDGVTKLTGFCHFNNLKNGNLSI